MKITKDSAHHKHGVAELKHSLGGGYVWGNCCNDGRAIDLPEAYALDLAKRLELFVVKFYADSVHVISVDHSNQLDQEKIGISDGAGLDEVNGSIGSGEPLAFGGGDHGESLKTEQFSEAAFKAKYVRKTIDGAA